MGLGAAVPLRNQAEIIPKSTTLSRKLAYFGVAAIRLQCDIESNQRANAAQGEEALANPKHDPDGPVVIKKYANRRLYNTAKSSYVTLEDLSQMVQAGEDFQVFDAKSGEDITRSVLAQIIFEQESKGQNMLPTNFLRQLIRLYGDALQSVVPSYLDASMETFARNQERLRETFGQNPAMASFEQLARSNMEWMDRAMRMFGPFPMPGMPPRGPGEAPRARPSPARAASARDPCSGPTSRRCNASSWRCRASSPSSARGARRPGPRRSPRRMPSLRRSPPRRRRAGAARRRPTNRPHVHTIRAMSGCGRREIPPAGRSRAGPPNSRSRAPRARPPPRGPGLPVPRSSARAVPRGRGAGSPESAGRRPDAAA